jgi:hypothetical protein
MAMRWRPRQARLRWSIESDWTMDNLDVQKMLTESITEFELETGAWAGIFAAGGGRIAIGSKAARNKQTCYSAALRN